MSGERELNFLGHPIKQIGAMPHAGKVEVIQNIPKPTNIKKVTEFLVTVNLTVILCQKLQKS